MDLYKYRRRLKKETAMEGMVESTRIIVNNTFHESPHYMEIFHNGIKIDARVELEADSNERKVLFRPDYEVFRGDIIEFDGENWLVIDTVPSQLYPTAQIDFCNEWLRWINDIGETKVYPCVVQGKAYDINEGQYVALAENKILIHVQYNEDTKEIRHKQRFILNGQPYEITGIDAVSNINYGKGFLELKAELTLLENNDDLTDNIANNENNGWGDW